MKILVCISKTPDTTAKIAFTDNNTKFSEAGVQFIINPYDEWYALVRALELKETLNATVHLITVGGADAEPVIRKALALGGDEAFRVDADSHDSYFIASQIAAHAQQENYDLIFTGKETIDYNGSSIGGMVAELVGAVGSALNGCGGGEESVCGGPVTSAPKLCGLTITPRRTTAFGTNGWASGSYMVSVSAGSKATTTRIVVTE